MTEAQRQYYQAYRERNRDRIREYARQWRKANPDKVAQYHRRYWERKEAELQAFLEANETGGNE